MALPGHGRSALKPWAFYRPQGGPVVNVPQQGWFFSNGQVDALALGAAIVGAAAIYSGTTIQPRQPQPEPQDSQWEFAQRNWDQPQPFFSKRGFPVAAAAAQPTGQFFARPQEDTTQLQPQVWRQQLDLMALSPGQGTFSPQQVEPDRQPQYFRAFFTPAAAQTPAPGLLRFTVSQDDPTQIQPQVWRQYLLSAKPIPVQFKAGPQEDPSQIAPWFIGQTIGQRVKPATGQFFAAPQDDPSQLQPRIDHQQLTSAQTVQPTGQWFARPQDDPSQLTPQFWRQAPPTQVLQTPPTHAFYAFPQDDPTQIQPMFCRIAVITNFIPPVPTGHNIIKAGIWSPGNTIYAGVRNG